MPKLCVVVVRWVDDSPQPGLVEAQFDDAQGRRWSFLDKWPIFLTELNDLEFPKNGVIRCEIIEGVSDSVGQSVVRISTDKPDGVWDAEQDQFMFEVFQNQLLLADQERTSS